MKAVELRRQLRDEELADVARAGGVSASEPALLAIIDRLDSEGRLPVFSKTQKDRIAFRAARLSGVPATPPSVRAAMSRGTWLERAAAASTMLKGAYPIRSTGSLSGGQDGTGKSAASRPDGVEVSRALATAIREVATPEVLEAQARVKGDAAAALRQEDGGAYVWEKSLAPLLREFVRNAESAGAARAEAALEALAAAAALTGRAKQGNDDLLPFQLGSAARYVLRETEARSPESAASARLAEDLAGTNEVRLKLWEDLDGEAARLLGAAAACAAFGKGNLFRRAASGSQPVFDGATLPEEWRERFAHMTAAEAASELSRMAADPRAGEDERAVAESAAEAALAHHGASRVSFAEALGLETPELRLADLRLGRMFRAAPRGRHPARVLCRGKHGRLIRCRAVADASGALIGYVAFDPLSREYGERPLMAAYGLDGRRQGYAWADERLQLRRGEPEQGFVSAPETIPL